MTTKTIKNAIAYLEATQISPRRWAYYATETRRWYKLTRADLEALALMLNDDGPGYAYGQWCSDGYGTEMPESWTP